jgi:cytochrome c553
VLRITSTVIAVFGLALASVASRADEDRRAPMPQGPYAAECGSCHVAYPARLLPRAVWGAVLGNLDRHFGVDASLDDVALAAVSRQLAAPTGVSAAVPVALPRITTAAWFRDEHDEVSAATWRRAGVKSAANCDACHPGAARGDFDEDRVSIPR